MESRAALITGAARRVGREIALYLAAQGWDLGLHYGRSKDDAESLADEVKAMGARCALYQGDLADSGAPAEIVGLFLTDFPQGRMLVNNASLFEHDTIEDLRLDLWNLHLAVNTLAPTLLMKAFHERGPGTNCLINFLDQKVSNVTPDYFSYTVSKVALFHITGMLARAYAPRSRVNAVAPGLLLPSGEQTVEQYERAHGKTPLGVGATVAEICHAVAFIAAAPSMTGQVITIDGGEHFAAPTPLLGEPGDG